MLGKNVKVIFEDSSLGVLLPAVGITVVFIRLVKCVEIVLVEFCVEEQLLLLIVRKGTSQRITRQPSNSITVPFSIMSFIFINIFTLVDIPSLIRKIEPFSGNE